MKRLLPLPMLLAPVAPVEAGSAPSLEAVARPTTGFHTLASAVQRSGLAKALSGGPYTLLAPTDAGFAALPQGVLPALLRSENKATLAKVLSYHLLAGSIDPAELRHRITAGGGSARIETGEGEAVTVAAGSNGALVLTDVNGNTARITGAPRRYANGLVYPIDAVLLPRLS